MNWLAHIFISECHIDYQLGNLLADRLKGKAWENASLQFLQGMKMHANIDTFTDSHVYVNRSKSKLGDSGRLRGVVIDIAYDHLLLKNWNLYCKQTLEQFIADFYSNAKKAIEHYPEETRLFVLRLIGAECLTSYDSFNGLRTAFQRFDKRLSSRVLAKESTLDYLPVLEKAIGPIEQDFFQFFPDLIRYFRTCSGADSDWIK